MRLSFGENFAANVSAEQQDGEAMMAAGDLEGRVAIVTGAAMGIGQACAVQMAKDGASVVLADIDDEAGNAAADAIVKSGGTAIFVKTDVSSMRDMETMAKTALDHYGSIDILVNNAAQAIGGVVDETDETTWNRVITTNLSSVWRGMKVCVPTMRKQKKGSVINMSSAQAFAGFQGWAAYATAKGGVNALTQQSAVDLAPHGIRVNAVAPGTIMTPLNEKVFDEHPNPDELIATWNRAHPIGRFGQPEEVAEAVTFLASDRASFITGEIVRVDGGLIIRGE
ncbi:MAG: SDR family NAD(P)-dependent oxidoreductase [Geminicoccales bacterium]